jgi:ribosomal protein L29
MAKSKTQPEADKTKKVKSEKKKEVVKKELTLAEMRVELQKVILQVRSGEESDTSKIKKLRKQIARELTKANKK